MAAGAGTPAPGPREARREGGGVERPAAAGGASEAPPPDAPPPPPKIKDEDDIWESSKPVERRSQALTDELHDCLGLFWSWVTCGGPGARVRQLYVNGRLSRCADEWARLRTCAAIRASSGGGGFLFGGGGGAGGGEVDVVVNPGPHPVWRIRSRKEARAFWGENYAHLGAGAVAAGQVAGGAGGGAERAAGAEVGAKGVVGVGGGGAAADGGPPAAAAGGEAPGAKDR